MRAYQVDSWFDGNGLIVEKGIVKGRKQEMPGWRNRGTYPDRKWAVKAARKIEKEEKTKTRIGVVEATELAAHYKAVLGADAVVSPDAAWQRHRSGFTLAKKAINRQGYDSQGRYYGIGEPLYVAAEKDGDHTTEFRAKTKAEAESKLRKWFESGFRNY
jgi:hypothetical protein